jgi:hypothetical protein
LQKMQQLVGDRTVNDMGEQSTDRLLTDEEYFAAFEEPVAEGRSPTWNIIIAQDAKTAESMQAQVDAAEADAARSMAAYKDAYAATQLMGQILEERSNEPSSCRVNSGDNGGGVDTNHAVTVARRGAVEIGEESTE